MASLMSCSVGLVFTCSSIFQALGNTVPALLASASRLLTFVAPLIWMSGRPWFQLRHVWMLSVGTVGMQAVLALWFVRLEFRARLDQKGPAQASRPEAAAPS